MASNKYGVYGDIFVGAVFSSNNCGDFIIENIEGSRSITVRFLETGYSMKATSGNIRKGFVKDRIRPSIYGVGFIGVGKFGRKSHDLAYSRWAGMLHRCYTETYKTYSDCYVCNEWHNFQNFARWFYKNYPIDGKEYDIDKDIMVKGNRLYSPETCCFVSHSENMRYVNINDEEFAVYNKKTKAFKFVRCLADFARENNLRPESLSRLKSGIYKHTGGWLFKGYTIKTKLIEV